MFDSCICIADDFADELFRFISSREHVAHKHHVCSECNDVIHPGDIYERAVFAYERTIETYKTCNRCVRVRKSFFQCSWSYG